MEKLVYLMQGAVGGEELAASVGACAGVRRGRLHLVDGDAELSAVLCVWLDCLDRRRPVEEALERFGARGCRAYLATEARLAGPARPGTNESRVVLFHRGSGDVRSQWYARWYDSLRSAGGDGEGVLRSTVVRPLDPSQPSLEGLVEVLGPRAGMAAADWHAGRRVLTASVVSWTA